MDSLFTQNVSDEAEDIPQTDEPVWILGRKYNALKELDVIRRDIRSKLWFTYRKGFIPIGGCSSTFTSDKGWGCMLRCGQMVLAQALITLHLGKDWQWMPETKNSTYLKILSRFEDKRAAAFSIHQIALMGASEGKEVGQWFGPNTIAQVLKKLVVYDEWSSITIHVALDNTLIINDILTPALLPLLFQKMKQAQGTTIQKIETESQRVFYMLQQKDFQGAFEAWQKRWSHCIKSQGYYFKEDGVRQCKVEGGMTAEIDGETPLKAPSQWKPLLLLIPLRLGLSEINPIYINGLKTSFKFTQSMGVIGGKPNLALYFIGCVGDEVIYLDPHTTQKSGSIEEKMNEEEIEMDTTYHCKSASRIPITGMDPSVALCFFCATEKEFKSLCKSMQEELILPEKQPLFELCRERLTQWSPADVASEAIAAASFVDFEHVERQYDTSDEEFELLG